MLEDTTRSILKTSNTSGPDLGPAQLHLVPRLRMRGVSLPLQHSVVALCIIKSMDSLAIRLALYLAAGRNVRRFEL